MNASHWEHTPATEINAEYEPEPVTATADANGVIYPPSTQFPSRQQAMDFIVNKLFFKYARPITSIARDGIMNHLPLSWRPSTGNQDILRPSTTHSK